MQTAEFSHTAKAVRPLIGREVAKEMADYMRANPGCTHQDLRSEGFREREIARHAEEAAAMAGRMFTRRLA
jgi:hypothetical protein